MRQLRGLMLYRGVCKYWHPMKEFERFLDGFRRKILKEDRQGEEVRVRINLA